MSSSLLSLIKPLFRRRQTFFPQQIRDLIEQKRFEEARKGLDSLTRDIKDSEAERHSLEGELLFHQQDDEKAKSCFMQALRLAPGLASAHYGLSLVLAEQQDYEMAAKHARFAVSVQPKNAQALAQLGYCQLCMGNLQLAEEPLSAAARLNPSNPYVWNNLGIVCIARNELHDARRHFEHALRLKPDFPPATRHLDEVNAKLGQRETSRDKAIDELLPLMTEVSDPLLSDAILNHHIAEALERCEILGLERPDDEAVAVLLMHLHKLAEDPQSGMESLEIWLRQHPDRWRAAQALGIAYVKSHRHVAGEHWLRQVVENNPDDKDALKYLGSALTKQERYNDAKPFLQRALDLDPDNVALKGMVAANLSNNCEYHAALAICEQLEADGHTVSCHGPALSYLGRFDEAMATIDRTLSVQPNDANLRMHRSTIRLLHEEFEGGWDDYSFRTIGANSQLRVLPFPEWKGEPITGKKIIVLAEQGLGDQIMFASCLPDLLALGPSEIVVEAIDRIATTVARSFPACRVIPTKQNHALDWVKSCPDMDYFIHMGDLPKHFRRHREDFPQHNGYLIAAPERIERWSQLLNQADRALPSPTATPRIRIGFSWRGGTAGTRSPVRTMTLDHITELAAGFDVDWVCLQYGKVEAEVDQLRNAGMNVLYWPESISDLDEFSAMISALDLVITVCNTTVHYAGALGKPVWIMAPTVPEWRYGLHSKSLPWYPSSTMYRQPTLGDWETLIQEIRIDLNTWMMRESSSESTQPPQGG